MANMSYCRFENTLNDLRDCFESIDDEDLSKREALCRSALIKLCAKILTSQGFDVLDKDGTDPGANLVDV